MSEMMLQLFITLTEELKNYGYEVNPQIKKKHYDIFSSNNGLDLTPIGQFKLSSPSVMEYNCRDISIRIEAHKEHINFFGAGSLEEFIRIVDNSLRDTIKLKWS